MQPKITRREAQPYAGIRKTLEREKLPDLVPGSLTTIFGFVQKHRLHVTGAPLIRYWVVDYNTGEIEIDGGVPVAATTLPADAVVHSAKIPAGSFATVIHRGSYDALVQTTAALMDWSQQNNINWAMVEQRKVTRWRGVSSITLLVLRMSQIQRTGRPRSRS